MTAQIIPFPYVLTVEERREMQERREYELRVQLSSEVTEVDPSEFERIQKEHESALIRQELLKKLDTWHD